MSDDHPRTVGNDPKMPRLSGSASNPDNEFAQTVANHDAVTTNLADLPLLPRDQDGPVFAEPWQAQAFAVVAELTDTGVITREEWAEQLGATLAAAEARGEVDTGARYYDHWLATLERIVVDKNIAAAGELEREGADIRANDHHAREHQLHGGHADHGDTHAHDSDGGQSGGRDGGDSSDDGGQRSHGRTRN